MTKKEQRIENRRTRLEELAVAGRAYCSKHNKPIDLETARFKHCHNGYHGRKWCTHYYER